jgi:hypothetical protein
VALATGEDVETHVAHALEEYLAGEGHRSAVAGFAARAARRHRTALDRLADP